MRLKHNVTFRSAEQIRFEEIIRTLKTHFPNLAEASGFLANLDGDATFVLRARNAIERLAFAPIDENYVLTVASPLVDEIHSVVAVGPELASLATLVDDLRSRLRDFDPTYKRELTKSAHSVHRTSATAFAAKGGTLVEAIARFGFATTTPSNSHRAIRAARLLALLSSFGISPRALAQKWREMLQALDPTSDANAMKAALKEGLSAVALQIVDRVPWTVVLSVDNIAMQVADFSLGDVRFYNPSLVEMKALGLLRKGAEGPPEFFGDRSARAVVMASAIRGDTEFAVEAARASLSFVLGLIAGFDENFKPNPPPPALAFYGSDSYQFVPGPLTVEGPRFWADARQLAALKDRFEKYAKPVLNDETIDSALREKYVRAVRLSVDAGAAAASSLYASALSSIWTAFEVLLLDDRMGDRGKTLARRLSSFAVGENTLRADEVIETGEGDLTAFVADCIAGLFVPTLKPLVDALGRLDRGEIDAEQAEAEAHIFGAGDVVRWRLDRKVKEAAALPAEERARLLRARVEEVVAEVTEWYRLRNDIVHGGYGATTYVKGMYDELGDMYRNMITNYAHNAARFKTCEELMARMDEVHASRTAAGDGAAETSLVEPQARETD